MFLMRQDYNVSYQYIETLSDETVKRYQSADFCFPLCLLLFAPYVAARIFSFLVLIVFYSFLLSFMHILPCTDVYSTTPAVSG